MKKAKTETAAERSAQMARVRGRDTKPEMRVRSALHAAGLRFRLHAKKLRLEGDRGLGVPVEARGPSQDRQSHQEDADRATMSENPSIIW
jgi:hypothetical protein